MSAPTEFDKEIDGILIKHGYWLTEGTHAESKLDYSEALEAVKQAVDKHLLQGEEPLVTAEPGWGEDVSNKIVMGRNRLRLELRKALWGTK